MKLEILPKATQRTRQNSWHFQEHTCYLFQQLVPLSLLSFDQGTQQNKIKLLKVFTICLLRRCQKIRGDGVIACLASFSTVSLCYSANSVVNIEFPSCMIQYVLTVCVFIYYVVLCCSVTEITVLSQWRQLASAPALGLVCFPCLLKTVKNYMPYVTRLNHCVPVKT